jgi:hypothetical protein
MTAAFNTAIMFRHRLIRPFVLSCSFALAVPAVAAPIAFPDSYLSVEDVPLVELAPGLLGNDNANGATGNLNAVKVTDPAHGTLALQSDGSFTYTPAANYFGQDSFTYKVVEEAGPITFTVVPAQSQLTVRVQSNVSLTGTSDDKQTTVNAKGTLTAALMPPQSPFGTAQIRTMNITTATRATITLCVAPLCLGTLTARIEPDGLSINMREDQAGPAVPVVAGSFNQVGNRLDATGTMFLSTGGFASGIEVPPSADLNSPDIAYDFNNATITQNGTTLTLAVPISIQQVITDPDYTATVTVSGTVRATAPVPAAAGSESNVVTVSLDIAAEDDAPVAENDRYFTRQNHKITVPATGSAPVNETLIAANSVWKYSTGTDLGTGWRAVNFNDTAWSTGTGVLGYGDPDIFQAGTIPTGPAGAFYPTAYFRREFNLTAPAATLEARLEFQRDDACVIWVNGTEVYRDSTPYAGSTTPPLAVSGEIAYATFAAADIPDAEGQAYQVFTIPNNLFLEGRNVIAVMVKQRSATSSDLRFDLKAFRTAQPTEVLVSAGSVWKFSTGADLGTAWRDPAYNDASWESAAGPLGYDTDIPPASTIPSSATAGGANYPTAYFRGEFTLTDPFDTVEPRIEFQRDDACIIYVNGVEIYRDSMPYTAGGALPFPADGEVSYGTFSGANIPEADSLSYRSVTFSPGVLREGRNVIAAEVHQNTATSSDLRFDLRALRTTGVGGVGSNDTDVDGPAFNVVLHSPPAHGTVQLSADGSFTYTPAPNFPASGASGTDSFVYRHTAAGQPFSSTALIFPMGGDWKFLDTGVAAPQTAAPITAADWRHADFDDAQWGVGGAEFGYGDGDEVTIVEDDATPGSPTAGSTTRHVTTYFRRKFDYAGAAALVSSLQVRAIRDDGIAIWLNGTRIVLDGLPTTWNHTTLATQGISGAAETTPLEVFDIPPGALREGQNILAVEIHQQSRDSSDISFNMELAAVSIAGARVEIVVLNDDLDADNMSDIWERANGIDDTVANANEDTDRDGQSHRAEFLAGTDPQLPSSALRAAGLVAMPGNQLQFVFDSVPGKRYRLQQSGALDAWSDTGSEFPAHPANPQTVLQFPRPALPLQFYRVRVAGDWQ